MALLGGTAITAAGFALNHPLIDSMGSVRVAAYGCSRADY